MGVFADLLEGGVDELEGAVGETAAPGGRFDPDGEDLGGEIALAGRVEV